MRAFCGRRSCATTQSYLSSGCSALRITKPSGTRELRMTITPSVRAFCRFGTMRSATEPLPVPPWISALAPLLAIASMATDDTPS
ncbi:hypothetical protein D3C86_682410 [compost metagenome]